MPALTWRGKPIAFDSFAQLAAQNAYGRNWYGESGESLAAYAKTLDLDPGYVCDVVAILSPRVSVKRNIELARSYLETGKAPGAMGQRLNALARYEASGIFTGPKVQAFSRALQGDDSACVVDAWIFRLFDVKGRGVKAYRQTCDRVRLVAAELAWPVAETQAALWCGARTLTGQNINIYSPLVIA